MQSLEISMQLCSLYNSNCVEKLDFNRAQLYPAVVRLIDYSFFHYKSTIGYSFNIILNITRPSHDICNFPRRNLSNFFIPDDRCINASGCFKSSQSRYTTFSPDWEFSPAFIVSPTLFNSMMAITVSWWAWYARLVYGTASSVRNEYYVKSAELLGASRAHIIFREILPNCWSVILTKMTLDMGVVILMGASLSFVGLGAQPPQPDLGTMVSEGYKLLPNSWWLTIFPAAAIMLIVLSFNLFGDGIGDMLKTKEE